MYLGFTFISLFPFSPSRELFLAKQKQKGKRTEENMWLATCNGSDRVHMFGLLGCLAVSHLY